MALTGCTSVTEIGPATIWSADRPG
jgi:hypothetical protein